MKSHYFKQRVGRLLLAFSFLMVVGLVSSTGAQSQWPRGRDQDRNYRRDRDRDGDRDYDRDQDWRYRRDRDYPYGRGGYGYEAAMNQGYQDGFYTGSNDSQRGQNYNPQRSHFYRNGHGDNGNYGGYGRYGNRSEYQRAYRDGFLRGYDQGFRRYGGYNRGRNNRNYGRWPFPW